MDVLEFRKLPLGFRFRPTDEEVVNHYLKRKITGKSRNEVEVIAEIDVCKWEPWDLPDQSLIKSDDSEWFFFSRKDRKYPNGNRTKRATKFGYWKATGKDRVVRSKTGVPRKTTVVGMKKTLVFHEGRAPKGVGTNWVMHEYRTTEPEYESGDQGGYVLYKLFKKSEEKSPGTNADEMETSGLSPPTKSSPCDTPKHGANAAEEFGTPMDPESPQSEIQQELNILPASMQQFPAGIKGWPADVTKNNYSVKPEQNNLKVVSLDNEAKPGVKLQADTPVEDLLDQICDADEQINTDGFPYFSSPQLTYTGHPFSGSNNQESYAGLVPLDNTEGSSLNALLGSVFIPENSSGRPVTKRDAAWGASASNSDLEIESGMKQGFPGVDSPDWLYGTSLMLDDSFQTSNTDIYPVIEPQLSALYENVSLLPYDSGGPDVFSIDAGTDNLQDLFNSMDPNYQSLETRSITEGTGITLRVRGMVDPSAGDNSNSWQGSASRRVKLQSALKGLSFSREPGNDKIIIEDKIATVNSPEALSENIENSEVEDDILSCTGSSEWAEMEPEDQITVCFQDLSLESDYPNSEASIGENDEESGENEGEENSGDISSDAGEVLEPALEDETEELPEEKPCSSTSHQPEHILRMRSKFQNKNDNFQESLTRGPIVKTSHLLFGRTLWVLPMFLLLAFGYGWFMIS